MAHDGQQGQTEPDSEPVAVDLESRRQFPSLLSLMEICAAFLKLGLTSFGGPIAHLGYLRAEFVVRRRWIGEDAYGDLVASWTGSKTISEFDSFYRSGSLVFGGGHVVLPLLRAEVVPRGWVSDGQFLAGYGGAQAVPGPLFTFAAYLGTVMTGGPNAWLGGLWCLLAVFLPAWLLIGGALPFWDSLRSKVWAQAALRGANAAVVGVLLAALYNPVFMTSVRDARDLAAALVGFGMLELWKVPPWIIVLFMAATGQLALR